MGLAQEASGRKAAVRTISARAATAACFACSVETLSSRVLTYEASTGGWQNDCEGRGGRKGAEAEGGDRRGKAADPLIMLGILRISRRAVT